MCAKSCFMSTGRLLRTVEEANDFIISNQNKVKDRDVARRDWETPEFGEREGFRRYGWPRLPWRRPVQGWGRQGLGRGEWGREG